LGASEGSQLDSANETFFTDQSYDPYYNEIYISDNLISNKHWFPTTKNDFGWLFMTKFPFNTPDIAMDGIIPDRDNFTLCLSNNGDVTFADLDAANDFAALTTDASLYECDQLNSQPMSL
jgi:hypothetical protein